MKAIATIVLVALTTACASGDSARVLVAAGSQPDADQVREIILRNLYDQIRDPDSVKQFEWLEGPRMVEWQTSMPSMIVRGVEQGWLYCYRFNAKNAYGAYVGVKTEGAMIRVLNGRPVQIPTLQWIGKVDC